MRQLRIVLGLLFAMGLVAPAMAAPTVTFDGNAKVRFGMQYVRVDQNDDAALMFMADQRCDQREAYFYGVMFMAHSLKDTLISFVNYETPGGFLANSADGINQDIKSYMTVGAAQSIATSVNNLSAYNALVAGYLGAGQSSKAALTNAANDFLAGAGQTATISNFIQGSQISIIALTNSLTTIQTSWKKAGISSKDLGEYINGSKRAKDRQSLWFGMKDEQNIRLNTNIKDEKFSAKISVDYQVATPTYDGTKTDPSLRCRDAWVAYDFGPLKVTYDTVKGQGRWNADLLDIGDYSAVGSLDFMIKPIANMGDFFVTFMSYRMQEGAKYEVFNNRILPITQLGYEIVNDSIDLKAGGVVDWYRGKDAATGPYFGYLGFTSFAYKIGKIDELAPGSMAFGFSGAYGQNVDGFAGINSNDDTDGLVLSVVTKSDQNLHRAVNKNGNKKDAQVRAVSAFSAIRLWTGALLFSDVFFSQARFVGVNPYDENDWIDYNWMAAYKAEAALVQFFSKNFNVKLGLGLECYSMRPYKDAAIIPVFAEYPKYGGWGFEVTLESEYLF